MTFKVRVTGDAESHLDRLFDFRVEREWALEGGDLHLPKQAVVALRAGIAPLQSSPFTCRRRATVAGIETLSTGCLAYERADPIGHGQLVAFPREARAGP